MAGVGDGKDDGGEGGVVSSVDMVLTLENDAQLGCSVGGDFGHVLGKLRDVQFGGGLPGLCASREVNEAEQRCA